jgi:hypothetical protein
MLLNSITILLFALIAGTSAWPTAFTSLVTRYASPDPVAEPATAGVITGTQVAIVNVYNTTSTNTNIVAGAKKCQTQGALVKLNDGVCWAPPTEALGIKLTSIVAGCKGKLTHKLENENQASANIFDPVYGYGTSDCSGDNQQISGATCYDVSADTGTGPASLFTVC